MKLDKTTDRRLSRRGFVTALGGLFFINACEAKAMKVVLNVVLFSYLDRPIFAVEIDGKVGETSDAYPNTGKGVIAGVEFTLGVKKVTWKLDGPKGAARNGETVTNKNHLELNEIVPGARYLGIHIYPGDIVELSTSVGRPEFTARGLREVAGASKNHGG
jgi:hypothetical protein